MTLKQHTKDVPGNSITFRRVFNAVLDKEMLSYIKAFKCFLGAFTRFIYMIKATSA